MDTRLVEEAIRGSEETLQKLMGANPLILDQAMSDRTGTVNLLNLAALLGNAGLAREILLKSEKEFICAFNSHGQSPLHVASAWGHVDVVKEILRADSAACFVRDRDGRIPLHVAAIKGQVEVLNELLDANEITPFLLTDTGEPILHLCANNNQFKALKKFVCLVKDENFVNFKDSNGNTVLHLVAPNGNSEVINFLLRRTKVDVNAVNMDGSSPMDLSVESEAALVNYKSDWDLICAGAKTTGSIGKKAGRKQSVNQGSWSHETQLVVAVLAITIAFQDGISPPGGVWQGGHGLYFHVFCIVSG